MDILLYRVDGIGSDGESISFVDRQAQAGYAQAGGGTANDTIPVFSRHRIWDGEHGDWTDGGPAISQRRR